MKTFMATYNVSFTGSTATSVEVQGDTLDDAKAKALAVPKGLLLKALIDSLIGDSDTGLEFIAILQKAAEDVTKIEISIEDMIEL